MNYPSDQLALVQKYKSVPMERNHGARYSDVTSRSYYICWLSSLPLSTWSLETVTILWVTILSVRQLGVSHPKSLEVLLRLRP